MLVDEQMDLLVDILCEGLKQSRTRSDEREYKSMYLVMAYQGAAFLNSGIITMLNDITPFEVEQQVLKRSAAHDPESVRRAIWGLVGSLEEKAWAEYYDEQEAAS